MSTLNGKGCGSSPIAATADYNLGWAPAGTVLIGDGYGNVASSEIQISSLAGGGGGSFDPLGAAASAQDSAENFATASIAAKIQTLRVPYTPTATDQNNYYSNIPVILPTPFADTNYSISVAVELASDALPQWAANLDVAVGYSIFDSNGNIQQVTTAGTTSATEPTWTTGPLYSGTTTDGTVVWTVYNLADFFYFNNIAKKTASGFVAQCEAYDNTVPVSLPIILSVIAIHD